MFEVNRPWITLRARYNNNNTHQKAINRDLSRHWAPGPANLASDGIDTSLPHMPLATMIGFVWLPTASHASLVLQ